MPNCVTRSTLTTVRLMPSATSAVPTTPLFDSVAVAGYGLSVGLSVGSAGSSVAVGRAAAGIVVAAGGWVALGVSSAPQPTSSAARPMSRNKRRIMYPPIVLQTLEIVRPASYKRHNRVTYWKFI